MTSKELAALCKSNGLEISTESQALLEQYVIFLIEWNQKINLISRKDEANVFERHVLHSLTLRMPAISSYDFTAKRVIDVGTGGGLPGIPLRIVTRDLDITLIDSIQKKIVADNDMISRLGLSRIRAVAGRAEELAKLPEYSGRADAVVSRAVAPLEELLSWTRGHFKPGGTLFSLKGGDLTEEIKRAERLSFVKQIDVRPLALSGYDAFEREGKKLVQIDLF